MIDPHNGLCCQLCARNLTGLTDTPCSKAPAETAVHSYQLVCSGRAGLPDHMLQDPFKPVRCCSSPYPEMLAVAATSPKPASLRAQGKGSQSTQHHPEHAPLLRLVHSHAALLGIGLSASDRDCSVLFALQSKPRKDQAETVNPPTATRSGSHPDPARHARASDEQEPGSTPYPV